MNTNSEKITAHSQNILRGDTLYNIKRKKYKTVCAEMALAKVTLDTMVMIFYRIPIESNDQFLSIMVIYCFYRYLIV
jgi:hypothetical protein